MWNQVLSRALQSEQEWLFLFMAYDLVEVMLEMPTVLPGRSAPNELVNYSPITLSGQRPISNISQNKKLLQFEKNCKMNKQKS